MCDLDPFLLSFLLRSVPSYASEEFIETLGDLPRGGWAVLGGAVAEISDSVIDNHF
jgi:hypothetical protein